MSDEARRIKTIFIVLTLAYITRTATFLVEEFVIESPVNYMITQLVMCNFWDILPLVLIMNYHKKNVVKPATFEELYASLYYSMRMYGNIPDDLSEHDPLFSQRPDSERREPLPMLEGTLFSN